MNPLPPRVLVVDDATTVRLYHRDILEAAGLMVEEASNGAEALEMLLLAPSPPALLVVDVNMPRMDGYAFVAAIRAEPALASVPTIMVTTEREESDAGRSYAAGANLFLRKPVRPEALRGFARTLAGLPA